jgi:hypothetical protein
MASRSVAMSGPPDTPTLREGVPPKSRGVWAIG